ncbi:MAG: thioredoxin [Acidobacteriota bacterium]|nr:thioredoxin [Acidobacteriota bacterium]
MSENILKVTDGTFEEEVLKSEVPVLVDFWAEWCGPCHMVTPTLEYLAQNYNDKMKVAKLNVDENMITTSKYGVMSIPTLLLFKNGEVAENIVGAVPQDKIIEILSKHL